MTTLHIQMMKTMKQLVVLTGMSAKSLGTIGLYGVLAAVALWFVHILTAPIGGIVLFSAIFTAALAGFACAVTLFHVLVRLPLWLGSLRQKQSS